MNYQFHKRAVAFLMMIQYWPFLVNHINYEIFHMDSQRSTHLMHMSDIVKKIAVVIIELKHFQNSRKLT